MPSYAEKINKLFYYWLLVSFALVFLIVIVGGLTRLTNSGLSITEWELLKGILPPLNNKMWDKYFSLYKEIPQYQLLFNDMTLNEFKIIFYWEYFHRILGRIIGLFFLLPLIFFIIYKKNNREYFVNCYLILFLITLQGIVGWYMVKSGLINNVTVSHYRLSLHLTIAFVIITSIFWILLNLRKQTTKRFFKFQRNYLYFHLLIFLMFLQIVIGAFVSGLDAGRIYQTWPLMNTTYFPNEIDFNGFAGFLNFDNQGLVQFYHRNIAYLISAIVLLFGYFIFKMNIRILFKPYLILFTFLLIQIFLGIFTLISGLNIYMASAHQICSLILILSTINLYYNYIK